MTPEQQHDIRNGALGAFRAARNLDQLGGLSPEQQAQVAKIMSNVLRIGQSVGMGPKIEPPESRPRRILGKLLIKDGVMRKRKSWMTNTGNALLGLGAAVASAAAVLPDGSEHKDWLLFAGIFSAGIGQVMANKGIRRRLPVRQD